MPSRLFPPPIISLTHIFHRSLCATVAPTPIDQTLLLRLCTILYQHQHATDAKLHAHLRALPFPPPTSASHHELFLQACARFPSSWHPIHRLHLFLTTHHSFLHSPTSFSKLLQTLSTSRNISLLHSHVSDPSNSHLLSHPSSLRAAARGLAAAREVSKCAQLLSLLPSHVTTPAMSVVVEAICNTCRLPDVAEKVVTRARSKFGIEPDGQVFGFLIVAYCRAGELAEACRVWSRMSREGMEVAPAACEEIVVTFFKANRVADAMRIFRAMREVRCYRPVISWLCNEGRVAAAHMVFGEMLKRGVASGNEVIGDLVYGLLVRRKVREGYRVFCKVKERDIWLYHGLIKGLVRIKRAAEATWVFREMIVSGCEPNMHTYIMLLQAHLGRRGRKGRDPLVNFESIFVGGLVKAGRTFEATKFVERMMWGGVEVPRFDYNKFLHCFSNDEGVVMFEEVGMRMKEVGLIDLGDIFLVYGERMATRDRRRKAMNGLLPVN